jgi:hypothetical protein
MSSTEADPADKPAVATDSAADSGTEDVRAKFREALDRKQHRHAAGAADSEGKDPSKVHNSHGPAGGKRTFRRKSG